MGGAVAEWSKALLSGEVIKRKLKDPGFAPGPGKKKDSVKVLCWSFK